MAELEAVAEELPAPGSAEEEDEGRGGRGRRWRWGRGGKVHQEPSQLPSSFLTAPLFPPHSGEAPGTLGPWVERPAPTLSLT